MAEVVGPISCVGETSVLQLTITYWVDVTVARQLQEGMDPKSKTPDFYADEPWFSDKDFDNLLENLKQVSIEELDFFSVKIMNRYQFCLSIIVKSIV